MNKPLRLRDDARIDLEYRDTTLLGSAVSGRADILLRRICGEALQTHRDSVPCRRSRDVMVRCFEGGVIGRLYRDADRLHDAVLYPDPRSIVPSALRVIPRVGAPAHRIPLTRAVVSDLAHWIGTWSSLGHRPRNPAAKALHDAIGEIGALTATPPRAPAQGDQVTMVGHATVVIARAGVRILIDPFILPPTAGAAHGYRPLSCAELQPDAVFITHCHPDHYDLGALLRFGADTPIYVPAVPRESLLSIDMCARLTDLGFRRVTAMDWGETTDVGPFMVHAVPFYGEQPTDADVLHPEVRNVGNAYLVDDGRLRYAFIADAGRDASGDCATLAARLREKFGPIDALFGGYRAWRLVPAQLLTTSVARYALFVPRTDWGRPMQLMNDAEDLLAVASRWGARWVVPYANGGAPWFWEAGLGPRLDGDPRDHDDFDPDLNPLALAHDRRRQADPGTAQVVPLPAGCNWQPEHGHIGVADDSLAWPYANPSTLFGRSAA